MQVKFWGTRGSLPSSVRPEHIKKKIRIAIEEALKSGIKSTDDIEKFIENELPFDVKGSYGCNTSCVEIANENEFMICDARSGIRDLGFSLTKSNIKAPKIFHIFISHLHWDHIQGFPFFVPAFIPGNEIHIYGGHEMLERAFIQQQQSPGFPLPLNMMAAKIHFHILETHQTYHINNFDIQLIKQNHPGDSYGFSFTQNNKKFVYSTDAEHKEEADKSDYEFIDFCKNADLLVFDAQYSLADHFHTKSTWGHSSNLVGVELSVRANVKRLCLFHNEHILDDHQLQKYLNDTIKYKSIFAPEYDLDIKLAYDGLTID